METAWQMHLTEEEKNNLDILNIKSNADARDLQPSIYDLQIKDFPRKFASSMIAIIREILSMDMRKNTIRDVVNVILEGDRPFYIGINLIFVLTCYLIVDYGSKRICNA